MINLKKLKRSNQNVTKKDQDLIGDRVNQLERENEMAQKEKEIIGTGLYKELLHTGIILEGWKYTIMSH